MPSGKSSIESTLSSCGKFCSVRPLWRNREPLALSVVAYERKADQAPAKLNKVRNSFKRFGILIHVPAEARGIVKSDRATSREEASIV